MKNTYSSAGLAKMLSVNESTVKRWADIGYIDCLKTKGGHRRFSTASVMKFVHENKLALPELADDILMSPDLRAHIAAGNIEKLAPELKKVAMRGSEVDVLNVLRTAVAAKPDLIALFENVVFPPLREIGKEWKSGEITVDVEHLASQTLRNALTRFQSEIHYESLNGLKAICGCFEGELHDIALLCASIYLSSRGWRSLFLGQMTPTEALLHAIKTERPNLVVLSAVTVENPRSFLRDVNTVIYPMAHKVGARLAVGGPKVISKFNGRLKADFVTTSMRELQSLLDLPIFVAKKVKAKEQ